MPMRSSGVSRITGEPFLSPAALRQAPIDVRTGKFHPAWLDWATKTTEALRAVGSAIGGLNPTGEAASARGLNAAIQSLLGDSGDAASRGAEIVIAPGDYLIDSPIVFPKNAPPILFRGCGSGTRFIRGANMPANQGMFDVRGQDVLFRDFDVDGGVTDSVGVEYASIGGNPMHSTLTQNTSFWLHGGCARIRFQGVSIRHTGGHAILIHAAEGLIRNVGIIDCLFENNRPHRFGTDPGDLNFGSWTGGVYVDGDGVTPGEEKVLRDFLVQHCTFRRNTGNCLWSHLYGLNELHSNFRFGGNMFEDCGLDGILVGGVSGGNVEGNVFRRIGYMCLSDSDRGTPRWLPNVQATALDSAGLVKGVCYKGNSMTSINGGCLDLDGHADGALTGNICRVPYPGEPEYDEDQIDICGPNNNGSLSYGVNMSNSNNHPTAGTNVEISGNSFINLPAGAVRLFAARQCHVTGNQIAVPDAPYYPPIALGNIGDGPYQRAQDNVVNANYIKYSPAMSAPAVIEDSQGHAFLITDVNRVFGNMLIGNGNATEFLKDPDSGSLNA